LHEPLSLGSSLERLFETVLVDRAIMRLHRSSRKVFRSVESIHGHGAPLIAKDLGEVIRWIFIDTAGIAPRSSPRGESGQQPVRTRRAVHSFVTVTGYG
jgi:hypothetical protein